MNETLIGILGGFVGSLFTVIASKVFEIIQEKKSHIHALQKQYFEKKLNAAEKAAWQWYILASSLSNLAILYERIPKQENEFEHELIKQYFGYVNEYIQKVSNASYELANSIFLYFDIEDSKLWNNEPIKRFFDKLAEVQVTSSKLELLDKYLESIKDRKQKLKIREQIETIEEKMKADCKEISNIFNSAKETYLSMLKDMRNKMKKYEANA